MLDYIAHIVLQDCHGAVQSIRGGSHMQSRALGGAADPKLPGIKHVELVNTSVVLQKSSNSRQAVGSNSKV